MTMRPNVWSIVSSRASRQDAERALVEGVIRSRKDGKDDAIIRPVLSLRGIEKRYGAIQVLAGIDLEIMPGEFFALLGPSGCGKSTLLRVMAGLEPPDHGTLLLDERDITAMPAHRRPLNLVFQSYALFPHMTVAANVAFGLQQEGVGRAERQRRVKEALALVGLEAFEARRPSQLSGGEQQRVALARALVKRPRVLLLDEPMAALDRRLREDTQTELKRIQAELGTTFILVTHDQDEAMALADRIAVMGQGTVLQCATPETLYARPASSAIAKFFGEANLLPSHLESIEGGQGLVRLADGTHLQTPVTHTSPPGTKMNVLLRPEHVLISLGLPQSPSLSRRAVVSHVRFQGDVVHVELIAEGWGVLKASLINRGAEWRSFSVGRAVFASIDQASIWLIPNDVSAI